MFGYSFFEESVSSFLSSALSDGFFGLVGEASFDGADFVEDCLLAGFSKGVFDLVSSLFSL